MPQTPEALAHDGELPMATIAEIRQRYEQQNAGLLAKASATLKRLTDAAALGTIHAHRLNKLAGDLRFAIREENAKELSHFLALYGPCFDFTIDCAEKAASENAASMVGRAA